jgi:general secretion pathway protein G
MRTSAQRGFTLLEMLVVLVIIGLLASLVGPKLFTKVDSSKVQTAETQIKMLKGALETMRLDTSNFPSSEQGLKALNTAPDDAKLRSRWKGPYLDEAVPDDPWGNPYQYRTPGPDGRPFYLFSYGADGKEGGEGIDADIGIAPTKKSN